MPSFSRTIKFTGDGAEVTYATDLPFEPPGLQWNGGRSITSRQLQEEREHMVDKQSHDATSN